GQRLADSGHRLQLFLPDQSGEVSFQLSEGPSASVISRAAKRVLSPDFQERTDFLQNQGDLILFHRLPENDESVSAGLRRGPTRPRRNKNERNQNHSRFRSSKISAPNFRLPR